MTIKLYKIKDDARVVSKTVIDTGAGANLVASVTAHYKDDVNILDPVLEISYDPSYTDVNYIYVQDWNRYYFVTNMRAGAQRLFFTCHVDVLMSYKTDIGKLKCFVARQGDASKSNRYLNDPYLPFTTVPDISIIGVQNKNMGGVASGTFSPISKEGSWIMSVACGSVGGA